MRFQMRHAYDVYIFYIYGIIGAIVVILQWARFAITRSIVTESEKFWRASSVTRRGTKAKLCKLSLQPAVCACGQVWSNKLKFEFSFNWN